MAEVVPFPYSHGRSTRYSDRLHDFSVTILKYYKGLHFSCFFSRTARLWNCLPVESFPVTYDLNSWKSKINRHL